jgi:hypothetical protein
MSSTAQRTAPIKAHNSEVTRAAMLIHGWEEAAKAKDNTSLKHYEEQIEKNAGLQKSGVSLKVGSYEYQMPAKESSGFLGEVGTFLKSLGFRGPKEIGQEAEALLPGHHQSTTKQVEAPQIEAAKETAGAPVKAVEALKSPFETLLSASTWIRVGKVIAGGLLLIFAGLLLYKSMSGSGPPTITGTAETLVAPGKRLGAALSSRKAAKATAAKQAASRSLREREVAVREKNAGTPQQVHQHIHLHQAKPAATQPKKTAKPTQQRKRKR